MVLSQHGVKFAPLVRMFKCLDALGLQVPSARVFLTKMKGRVLCPALSKRLGVDVYNNTAFDLAFQNIRAQLRKITQGRGMDHRLEFVHGEICCDA
jgi:hypothetical protein